MASFNYLLAAIFVALSFKSCVAAKQEDVVVVVVPQTNATSTERTAARTGRIMQIFKTDHSRAGSAIRHVHPQPGGMRARADRFPAPPGGMQQRHPIVYQRRPLNAVRPQILRRVQNNLPLRRELPPRYEVVKSSRYSNVKSGPQHAPGVQGGAYPNALTQQGSAQSSYGHHFKASPNFNGNVEVRPAGAAQYPLPQREQQRYSQYVDPRGQQQLQSLNQREQFTLSSFESQPPPREQKFASQQQQQQFSYYQQPKPQPEPLLRPKPKIQRVKFEYPPDRHAPSSPGFNKATAPSGYAVYEDPDQLQAAEDYAAQTSDAAGERREAQEYLKFMSSNVYFLPKRDPNYRDIDVERDHLQYEPHQQQQQQQHHQQQQQQNYQLQQQQQIEQEQLYSMTPLYDSSSAPNQRQYSNHHNQHATPKSGSPPFFEAPSASSSSGAIVRGSYQAGQNEFIVSSDGKKGIKHIVSAPLMPSSTSRTPAAAAAAAAAAASSSAAITYQHFHLGGAARNRTPEPVRFEFTERDAISPATYTHSPLITGQLRKASQGIAAAAANNGNYVARSTPRIPTSIPATTRQETASNYDDVVKPINENLDDPEDDDDMLETDANTYGRVAPYSTKTGTSQEPPNEQKDTEDYCERICSNVQDDDEEIVCGSDGYMYTSEAQMECYASCLHIDVTIQSKGACSKR